MASRKLKREVLAFKKEWRYSIPILKWLRVDALTPTLGFTRRSELHQPNPYYSTLEVF
jgi:hypothetical protein